MKKTNEKLDNITETLQRLIDEGRVKANLLKLEAREAWGDMEKILTKIGRGFKKDLDQTEQNIDEALLAAHLGMMEAKQEWNEVKDSLKKSIQSINASEKIDRAVLQAHLAKMDVEDRFEKEKKEWKKDYNEKIKPQLESSMKELQVEMRGMVESLHD